MPARRPATRPCVTTCLALVGVLCLPCFTWGCRREAAPASAGASAKAPSQPPVPQPSRLPAPEPPLVAAVLYLAEDGPHIVVVAARANRFRFADEAVRTWHYTPVLTWDAPLAADGTLGAWADGPPLRPKDGWDGRGLCVVQCGADRLTVIRQGTPDPTTSMASPHCQLIVERDGHPYSSDDLQIPDYRFERTPRGHKPKPLPVVRVVSDPSVAIAGGRLWMAGTGDCGQVLLGSAKWDDPRKLVWDAGHRFEAGYSPSTVADDSGGVFLAYLERPEGAEYSAWGRGPVAVHHSDDGKQWEALPSPAAGGEAHSVALALDPAQGLCALYTAEAESGRPLMALRSADFGRTWGEPVMLSEPTVYTSQPRALCHGGSLYVVFRETTPPLPTAHGHSREGDPLGIYTLVLDPAALPAA